MPATREEIARLEEAYRFVKQSVSIAKTRDLDRGTLGFELIKRGVAVLYNLDAEELVGSVRQMLIDFEKRIATGK